jgi:putative hydrolase of the HAD superfamily
MSDYAAIFFDLDGTLRASKPERHEAFAYYAEHIGLRLSPAQMRECEVQAHRYWASNRVDADIAAHGGLSTAFWVNYHGLTLNTLGITDCDGCAERIQQQFEAHYDPDDMLFGDAHPVLRSLKQAGYVLGLVSNRDDDLAPLAEKYGLQGYFDFLLWGGLVKSYKPDRLIFDRALERAGLDDPRHALYIGDNYFADVVGARNAGMDVILIDPRNIFADLHDKRVRRLGDILPHIPPKPAKPARPAQRVQSNPVSS